MPAYTLNSRQRKALDDTWDFYRPLENSVGSDKRIQGETYELVEAGIKVRLQFEPEAFAKIPLGQLDAGKSTVAGLVRMHIEQECGDRYFLRQGDKWIKIIGESVDRYWRGREKIFAFADSTVPPGVSV